MAKGDKRLVSALVAFVLVAGAAAILWPRSDGLDWIRKYKATELVETQEKYDQSRETTHTFFFYDKLSLKLHDEIFDYRAGGHAVSVDEKERTVKVYRRDHPSWIGERWKGLKKALGLGPPKMTFASR